MKNWYAASTDEELAEFLEMFWEFHDFRIQCIVFSPRRDCVSLVLEYDSYIQDGGYRLRLLLRFVEEVECWLQSPWEDYYVDYIGGATLYKGNDGKITWLPCEPYECPDSLPSKGCRYIKARNLQWAVIDNDGKPVPIPEDLRLSTVEILNTETGLYEEVRKEFHPREKYPLVENIPDIIY